VGSHVAIICLVIIHDIASAVAMTLWLEPCNWSCHWTNQTPQAQASVEMYRIRYCTYQSASQGS